MRVMATEPVGVFQRGLCFTHAPNPVDEARAEGRCIIILGYI